MKPLRSAGLLAGGSEGFGGGGFDGPREAEGFEEQDDPVGEIDLKGGEAVSSGGWEGVVIVMPTLAEGREGDEPVIAALVGGIVGPCAEDMADGIDTPGDVVSEENPGEAAPDPALPEAVPGLSDETLDQSGQEQSEADPKKEEAVDDAQHRIFGEVGGGGGALVGVLGEDPADVGMPEPEEQGGGAGFAVVRGVRISGLVAILVVFPVSADPEEDGTLDGHGAEDCEQVADGFYGFETAVSKVAMVTESDAETGGEVEAQHEADSEPIGAVEGEIGDGAADPDDGEQDSDDRGNGVELGLQRVGMMPEEAG